MYADPRQELLAYQASAVELKVSVETTLHSAAMGAKYSLEIAAKLEDAAITGTLRVVTMAFAAAALAIAVKATNIVVIHVNLPLEHAGRTLRALSTLQRAKLVYNIPE